MISILYGDDEFLIREKLDEIISKSNDSFVNKFDCNDKNSSIDDIVNACTSVGLFSNSSLVLVKDPYFLIRKVDEKELSKLLEYCKKPVYETNLVFYSFDYSFNERLKIFKDIASNADVIKINKMNRNDFNTYAHSVINSSKLNINRNAIELLISSCNLDSSLLNRNIEVLKLYPGSIDELALTRLITIANEDDVFKLINALTSKKVSLSINYANKLLENDESILRLISTLASQLRFLYAVAYYRSIGKNTKDIMELLNIKSSYRIEKADESLLSISMDDIEKLLSKLSDLDLKCKTNYNLDDKLNLELFIVSLLG